MKLIIFDIDGTLIDSEKQIFEAQCRAFKALHLAPPTRQACLDVVGLSLREAFTALVGHSGPVSELVMSYKAARAAMRAEGVGAEMPFPGAVEALATLRQWPGVLLGVATGKPREGVERTFMRLGWDTMFATVQTADDGPSKPDPSMLIAALRETGIRPEDAVMIGDTTYDVEMARRADVECIGVAWGNHQASMLRTAGASHIVSDFDELLERLHAFLGCTALTTMGGT